MHLLRPHSNTRRRTQYRGTRATRGRRRSSSSRRRVTRRRRRVMRTRAKMMPQA
jgi:hypothetical protein